MWLGQVELQLLEHAAVAVASTPLPAPLLRPPSSVPNTAGTLPFSPSTDPFIRGFSAASHATPSRSGPGGGGGRGSTRRCKLLVLVSRAENIPKVTSPRVGDHTHALLGSLYINPPPPPHLASMPQRENYIYMDIDQNSPRV